MTCEADGMLLIKLSTQVTELTERVETLHTQQVIHEIRLERQAEAIRSLIDAISAELDNEEATMQ